MTTMHAAKAIYPTYIQLARLDQGDQGPIFLKYFRRKILRKNFAKKLAFFDWKQRQILTKM
jgi:hypothetical protein